jgi:hypothetical protein
VAGHFAQAVDDAHPVIDRLALRADEGAAAKLRSLVPASALSISSSVSDWPQREERSSSSTFFNLFPGLSAWRQL